MRRDLIVFGEDWGVLPSSTQHLIHHLAKDRRILWVNSIGLRSPQLNLKDLKRIWTKITAKTIKKTSFENASSTKNQDHLNKIQIINPFTLPAPRSHFARKVASEMLSRQLKPIIKAANFHDPIVWTSLPTAVDIAEKLNASSIVYYCGDDFSSLAGVDHKTVALREKELIQDASLILTASEILFHRLYTPRTKNLPHGVDYSLFSSPTQPAEDLPQNNRPTAGFYGSISEWLDYDLLEKTIQRLPHWNFVFIGKRTKQAAPLMKYQNTYFLGSRPHQSLPMYVQHWNVSLLPFLHNAQINSCNPLKLLEYLAAGKPIVSTPFPALETYKDFVSIANTPEEFICALEKARKHTSKETKQQKAVEEHTWQARAKTLNQWLDAL